MINLISERLKYTQLSHDDFPYYARLVTNEDVMKFITGKALTISEAEQRFQKALSANDLLPDAGFFLVRLNQSNEVVGVSKLVQYTDNQLEVGYMLFPEYWSRGYASEITERMIELAAELQFAGELIGIVDPLNPASIRVLTKSGFQLYETGQIHGLDAEYYSLKLAR